MLVIVNATASRESGALSILKQFLHGAKQSNTNRYIVFVPVNITLELIEGIEFIEIDTTSWMKRLRWDYRGLAQFLNANKLQPDLIISFQNMGVFYNQDVPQVVYFHNQIVLERKKWSIFKRDERMYFFYQNVYPLFVRLTLPRVKKVIVQTEHVKIAFSSKFRYSPGDINVVSPCSQEVNYSEVSAAVLDERFLHLVYVATPLLHKNHLTIVGAVALLHKKGAAKDLRIHFTCEPEERLLFVREINRLGLEEYFVFQGILPFHKVLGLYKAADVVLFPSYLETVGLPLIEAALAGVSIICSDLPYAHEVLEGYKGAQYIAYDSIRDWADAILNVKRNKTSFSFHVKKTEGWDSFFTLINSYKNATRL